MFQSLFIIFFVVLLALVGHIEKSLINSIFTMYFLSYLKNTVKNLFNFSLELMVAELYYIKNSVCKRRNILAVTNYLTRVK